MDRKKRRKKRLQLLIEEAGSQVALASKVKTAPSYISQMLGSRGVPDSMAPRLEKAMRKPDGWMDQWLPEEAGFTEAQFSPQETDLLQHYRQLPPDLREPVREMIETTTDLLAQAAAEAKKKPAPDATEGKRRPHRNVA